MPLSSTLKQFRLDHSLTQNEFAEIMQCNRQKIADWERGKSTPSTDDLILISKHFGVSTDYLLGLSHAPTTDKDKAYICEYTGLSLAAVDKLKDVTKEYGDTVELFIRSIRFKELMGEIDFYCVQASAYGNVFSMGNIIDSRRNLRDRLNLRLFNIQEYSKEIAKEIHKKKQKDGDLNGNH